jgi:hypothetical protein
MNDPPDGVEGFGTAQMTLNTMVSALLTAGDTVGEVIHRLDKAGKSASTRIQRHEGSRNFNPFERQPPFMVVKTRPAYHLRCTPFGGLPA